MVLLAMALSGVAVTATAVQAAGSADFTLTASPSTASAVAGAAASYTATVTSKNGFNADLSVAVSGLPTGTSASFVPASPWHLSPGGIQNVAVTVATTASTPLGTYTLTISGTGGGKTHGVDVKLKVTGPADFSLSVTPSLATMPVGSSASYTAKVAPINGFTGTVNLVLSSLPGGLTGGVTPTSLTFASATDPARTAAITVTAPPGTAPNTYPLGLSATSGTLSHSTGFSLKVTPPAGLGISVTPASATVAEGDSAVYTVSVTRTGITGKVSLAVTGLPAGASGSFAPNPIAATATTSVLTVRTAATTPTGDFPLTVTGTLGTVSSSAVVHLVVIKGSLPFTISGDLAGLLLPGRTLPLDLTVTNPNDTSIQLTNLWVSIDHVDAGHPGCTVDPNYAVLQFTGPYARLVVPANGSATLQSLLGPTSQGQWPQVRMIETHTNQDACKGAQLTLTYGGSAKGGNS